MRAKGWTAILCLVAAPVFGAAAPTDPKARLESIDRQLRSGDWEAAATAAREAVVKARLSPFGQDLALPVSRLALAEAGLGQTDSAVWHWQVSQNLDPHLLSAEALRAFGPPGELLDRNRLRPAGQPPAGLDVQAGADTHLRRLQGEEPKLSPQVAALPVPKWLRVQLVIDTDGRPRDPVVLGGGLPGMAWEVLEAVRSWRFEPFQADGHPRAVFYQLSINPPGGKPLAAMMPADPLLAQVEAALRAGDWKEAHRQANAAWPKVLNLPTFGRPGLAMALTLLALADAGSGMEAEAVCRWQAAQTVDPAIYHADLSAYGAPGALLARNRWGEALPGLADRSDITAPKLGKHGAPSALHWKRGAERVLVAGVIDEKGGVRQPLALFTSMRAAQIPKESLEAGALHAICGWSFQPATAAGRPVAVAQTVVIDFAPGHAGGVRAQLQSPSYTTPLPPGRLPPSRPWERN